MGQRAGKVRGGTHGSASGWGGSVSAFDQRRGRGRGMYELDGFHEREEEDMVLMKTGKELTEEMVDRR
jgi:hypothetical protein